MKLLSLKTFVLPILMMFLMASCAKEEIVPPRAEATPVNVLKGGEEMSPVKTKVEDTSQSPISGATITLYQGTTAVYEGFTDATGNCTISDVEHGTYDFEITASGYVTFHEGIVVSGTIDRVDELTAI